MPLYGDWETLESFGFKKIGSANLAHQSWNIYYCLAEVPDGWKRIPNQHFNILSNGEYSIYIDRYESKWDKHAEFHICEEGELMPFLKHIHNFVQ